MLLVQLLLLGLVLRLEPREHPGFALHIGAAKHDAKSFLQSRDGPGLIEAATARIALIVCVPDEDHGVNRLAGFRFLPRHEKRGPSHEIAGRRGAPVEAVMRETYASFLSVFVDSMNVEERVAAPIPDPFTEVVEREGHKRPLAGQMSRHVLSAAEVKKYLVAYRVLLGSRMNVFRYRNPHGCRLDPDTLNIGDDDPHLLLDPSKVLISAHLDGS